MFNEGRKLPVELRGVLCAQVYLVVGAADPEPHRLFRWATIKIILQRDGYLLCHPASLNYNRLTAPYKTN
jgi:hypothetical protein